MAQELTLGAIRHCGVGGHLWGFPAPQFAQSIAKHERKMDACVVIRWGGLHPERFGKPIGVGLHQRCCTCPITRKRPEALKLDLSQTRGIQRRNERLFHLYR